MELTIKSADEEKLRAELTKQNDPEAARLKRFLALADLSRTSGSPIAGLAKKIIALPEFKNFDILTVPEIVPASISFDLFDFAPDHPARSRSDTYYVDEQNILRTHTTVMWYYHLEQAAVREKVKQGKSIGALAYGKVYRKDEIDRHHLNVFHQMDGWYICPRQEKEIGAKDLEAVLVAIVQAIFGPEVKYRFNPDSFPYTNPSLEMEVNLEGDKWVEVLGAGVVSGKVLEKLGVDPKVYNGWAFGFGLERLAILSMKLPDIRLLWSGDERVKRQLKLGQVYQEVSKYPPITRDISFIVPNTFVPNNYFDLIRDLGGDLVEEVELIDKYENAEKFGKDKVSYTYRVTYRAMDRTLTTEEIEPIHHKLEEETKTQFQGEVR